MTRVKETFVTSDLINDVLINYELVFNLNGIALLCSYVINNGKQIKTNIFLQKMRNEKSFF